VPPVTSSRALFASLGLCVALSMVMVPIPFADSVGSVLGSVSFLCELDWDHDEFPFLYEESPHGPLVPAALRGVNPDPSGQRLMAFTSLGHKLAGVPAAALIVSPWWGSAPEVLTLRASQLTAGWTMLVVAGFLLAALRRITPLAVPATAAAVWGSNLIPHLRLTLWSNQVALVGVAAVVWLALRTREEGLTRRLAIGLGAAVGWAVLSRVATVLICVPVLAAVLWEQRRALRSAGWIVAAGAPFAALLLIDNYNHTGSPFEVTFAGVASDIAARLGRDGGAFSGDPVVGLAGLLVSPSRGLLVFSPWVLLALPGAVAAVRGRDPLRGSLVVGIVAVLAVNAGYADWWGASCWGPRRLLELLPAFAVLSFDPAWGATPPRWFRRLAPPLVAWSVFVSAIGFFAYDSRWDAQHEPLAHLVPGEDGLRYDLAATGGYLWSVRDGVLVDALRRLPQTGLQFGREAEFTLAVGKVVPAPIPPCSVLRAVDRFPPRGDGG
jgi:hypothetical protein